MTLILQSLVTLHLRWLFNQCLWNIKDFFVWFLLEESSIIWIKLFSVSCNVISSLIYMGWKYSEFCAILWTSLFHPSYGWKYVLLKERVERLYSFRNGVAKIRLCKCWQLISVQLLGNQKYNCSCLLHLKYRIDIKIRSCANVGSWFCAKQ